MKIIKYFLFNGLFGYAIYLGIFEQNEIAENIFVFVAWTISILSPLALNKDAIKAMKKKGFSVPQYIDLPIEMIFLAVFIGYGYFWMGAAYLFNIIMIAGLRAEVNKND